MIIHEGIIISTNDENVSFLEIEGFKVYYKGFIYIPGKKAGEESLRVLVREFFKDEIFCFDRIYGNYFVYLIDDQNKRQFIFIDNSGLFKIYKYKNSISTSFLELIDYYKEISVDNLDYNSIVEFLHYGFSYFENTFINEIKRFEANEFVEYNSNKISIKNKRLAPVYTDPVITIDDYFKDLIFAIDDKSISIDLTGGFDSRLVLSFFKNTKLRYELAISGIPNNRDIIIGDKIGSIINKEFYATIHSTENLSSNELMDIFLISDAQIDILSYHRNNQLNVDRKRRNIDIQLSGIGGELYKDFWWLQDFPFYNNKKSNISKLYDLRIEATKFPHSILSEHLLELSTTLRERTIKRLKTFSLDSNTKTYDYIYFGYKMNINAGYYISIANNYFTSYAPLLERELVKIGFSLKRRVRFFNYFHRNHITKNWPEISRIRTTDGTTASSLVVYVLVDVFYFVFDKGKRLLKQILRKLKNKTYFQESPTNSSIYSYGRSNDRFISSLEYLRKVGILNDKITPQHIPNRLIGRILTLGILVERLGESEK